MTDVNGLLLAVKVHEANRHDGKAAPELFGEAHEKFWKRLLLIWADSSYKGSFSEWVWEEYGLEVEVKTRPEGESGFVVIPRRWVVERSFAWIMKYRRMSKNYEVLFEVAEAMVQLTAINLMLNRLTTTEKVPYQRDS